MKQLVKKMTKKDAQKYATKKGYRFPTVKEIHSYQKKTKTKFFTWTDNDKIDQEKENRFYKGQECSNGKDTFFVASRLLSVILVKIENKFPYGEEEEQLWQ